MFFVRYEQFIGVSLCDCLGAFNTEELRHDRDMNRSGFGGGSNS